MNFKVSNLLLVVSLCYVSADLKASVGEKTKTATEDDGIWIKNDPHAGEHLLLADAGAASSTEPPSPPTTQGPPVVDNKGDWSLNYTSSSVCSRLVAEITLKVSYTKSANVTEESEIIVPKTAVATGNCTNSTMILNWPSRNNTKKNDTLEFMFSLNTAKQVWQVVNISGNVTVPVVSKTNNKTHQYIPLSFYTNNTGVFNAHVGMSYMCLRFSSFDLTLNEQDNKTNHSGYNFTSAALTFSQFQIEAFKPNKTNNSIFGSANNCEMTPDMVPIAVGCALAGLVVIVLVAYLIAQRKPPAQGYRSV